MSDGDKASRTCGYAAAEAANKEVTIPNEAFMLRCDDQENALRGVSEGEVPPSYISLTQSQILSFVVCIRAPLAPELHYVRHSSAAV